MLYRVDELIDRTRTSRHSDINYMNSLNAATTQIVKDRVAAIRLPRKYSVQSAQRLRDELYTLVPAPVTAALSSGNVPYPADYQYFLLLYLTINSVQQYCRPTSYNTIGDLINNPFRKPTVDKPYYNEFVTGIKIHFGATGTAGNYELWYLKNPATITIGKETQKIVAAGTLTNALVYMTYEEAVYAGTTYYAGDLITGTGATLTSGIVILNSLITSSDLPVNMHEEICKATADLLSLNVEDYQKKQTLSVEVEKS